MRRLMCLLCAFVSFLMITACASNDTLPRIGGSVDSCGSTHFASVTIEDEPIEEVTGSADELRIEHKNSHNSFVICDDVMTYTSKNISYIGSVVSEGYLGNLSDRYSAVVEEQGVLPPLYKIDLIFSDIPPVRVTWSVSDGLTASNTSKKNAIPAPAHQTTILLEQTDWYVLSSSMNCRPNRQLHIICYYPSRIIEYFLVLET